MALLTTEQLHQARALIFQQGRLLERQLYRYFFEDGDRADCLKALTAYQNPDGGFGNGLEPDLLCPDSSAIGAETALFVLGLLDYWEPDIIEPLLDWLEANQTEAGDIPHPPANMTRYPYQPWWANPDKERVLVIAGMLSDWQAARPNFFARVRQFYEQLALPTDNSFYSYPFFVYLHRCQQTEADAAAFQTLLQRLPAILSENDDHYPLFGRYWSLFQFAVAPAALDQAAAATAAALRHDPGAELPYPELPWWEPIFTLDHLVLLQKGGYL